MEMKGNGDTFATVASDFYVHTKYVSVTTLEFTTSHTVQRVGWADYTMKGTAPADNLLLRSRTVS